MIPGNVGTPLVELNILGVRSVVRQLWRSFQKGFGHAQTVTLLVPALRG
jgi:hypothetical protein